MSRAWIEVSAGAIAHNARTLKSMASGAELCAVVKANGYGHDSVISARAAIQGGASRLAVAQVTEGVRLRKAGIEAPIWLFSEPAPEEFSTAREHRLEPPVYSEIGLAEASRAGTNTVHLTLDTGMHRVGAPWAEAASWAGRIVDEPNLELGSVWTHLSVSDEPGNPFTDVQLDRFDAAVTAIEAEGISIPLTHTANSGATVGVPRAHRDVVRPGLSLYGADPSPEMAGMAQLEPAMRVVTRVSYVKEMPAGSLVGYGRKGLLSETATIATIPIGYADGIRRSSWKRGGTALVGGKRLPFVGRVSMDQILIDCGQQSVQAGDEVVLLGRQGTEEITVWEIAESLGTIANEVLCDLGERLDRIEVE